MADAHAESKKRFADHLGMWSGQRRQMVEDIAFSDPTDPQQWDDLERRQRETDPGGARPCLTFDQTGQYTANVVGQIEQNPPALHAVPVGGGSDKKVAEQLDGHFRYIEYASKAQQHYMRAETSAARAGVGYLIVRPEYTERALGYQEPRIDSEGDPLSVVFDPWSVMLDGSDANIGWLLTAMSHGEFERRWPAKGKVSFGSDDYCDERESIVVAEEWRVETVERNIILARTSTGDEASYTEDDFHKARAQDPGLAYLRNYRDKQKKVLWSFLSGADVLAPAIEYPASGIGIVPVYGYVAWKDKRLKYCGIPRRARSAQQDYNYHQSELRAITATAHKAPWWVPIEGIQDEQHKALLDRAGVEHRAWLPYKSWDEVNNRQIPPPSRAMAGGDVRYHLEGAAQAQRNIEAALGMYAANLGRPSNETSGVAIENRKEQGEASTANFPAHLAAGITQVGRLCVEMIPRLIDTKRQVQILGIDGTSSEVTVDPKQKQAVAELPNGGGLSINPNVGKYDARVVVGAAFATQRTQAQEAFTEMMRANPQMMPAIAPLWALTVDSPYSDKLSQVLAAVAPPEVRAILQPDQQPGTAELQAQIQQLQQAVKEAISVAEEAEQDLAECQAKLDDKSAENDIKAYDSETKRLQVLGTTLKPEHVQALVMQTVERMLSNPDPLPGDEPTEAVEPHAMQAFPGELDELHPDELPPEPELSPTGEEVPL